MKSVALLCYPIGSYYFTSDNSFNPNNAWGGKWERIQDGRVLISESITHSIGEIGGSETVSLTESQIPKHSHPHTHTRGTMNITGSFGAEDRMENAGFTGVFSKGKWSDTGSEGKGGGFIIDFDASRSWTGETSKDNTQTGGGQAHNNMQPYRVCAIWHRIA